MCASTPLVHLLSIAICRQPWKSLEIGTTLVVNTTTTPDTPIASNVISRSIRVDGDVLSAAEKIDTDETAATGVVAPAHHLRPNPRRDNPRRQRRRSRSGQSRGPAIAVPPHMSP